MQGRHIIFTIVTAILWALTGCVGSDEAPLEESVDSLQSALESEDGQLGTGDEAPFFGAAELFEEMEIAGEEPEVMEESLALGPEGDRMLRPGVEGLPVHIIWGQPHFNPDIDRPQRWDGSVSVNAGGVMVGRVIRFEPETDALLPRPNRQVVPFSSITLPHNDGLLLILARDPDALSSDGAEPTLIIRSEALADPVVVPIADLADGYRRVIPVDRDGNVMVITSVPDAPCPRGLVGGVWREVTPGLGTFYGRWQGRGGVLEGHVRGIWGVNRRGEQVIFGKYITLDGTFRGLLRGTYDDGELRAAWIGRSGRHLGGLVGHYHHVPSVSDIPGDGLFFGHWAERCDDDSSCDEGSSCDEVPSI